MPTLTGAFAFTVVAQTAAAVVHLVGLRSLTPPAPSGDAAGTRRARCGVRVLRPNATAPRCGAPPTWP